MDDDSVSVLNTFCEELLVALLAMKRREQSGVVQSLFFELGRNDLVTFIHSTYI